MAAAAFDRMQLGQTHSAHEKLVKMIHKPREKKPFERLAGEEIPVVKKEQQYLLSGLFFDLKQKPH
jgi:hypothetical protein